MNSAEKSAYISHLFWPFLSFLVLHWCHFSALFGHFSALFGHFSGFYRPQWPLSRSLSGAETPRNDGKVHFLVRSEGPTSRFSRKCDFSGNHTSGITVRFRLPYIPISEKVVLFGHFSVEIDAENRHKCNISANLDVFCRHFLEAHSREFMWFSARAPCLKATSETRRGITLS